MKLLDIDNTVARGVENIARMGMSMLTLHAYPKAMRAAVEAARGSGLCLLGVTVLTSMDEQDMIDAGYEYDPHTLVLRRAEQAFSAGMGGIVCSASEAAAVSKIVGPGPCGGDARHQAGRRRAWRPEARGDAGATPSAAGRAIWWWRRPIVAARRQARRRRKLFFRRWRRPDDDKGGERWRRDTGSPMSM